MNPDSRRLDVELVADDVHVMLLAAVEEASEVMQWMGAVPSQDEALAAVASLRDALEPVVRTARLLDCLLSLTEPYALPPEVARKVDDIVAGKRPEGGTPEPTI